MLHEFSLPTLVNLDGGRITEAWLQALKRCARDCEDRPAVEKPRKVVLELSVRPVMDEQGGLDTIRGTFQIKDTAPARESKVYDFGLRQIRGGDVQLVFNDLSDDNVNQSTIDMADEFKEDE